MKILLTVWTRFVNYLYSSPTGNNGKMGGYASLCGLAYDEDRHFQK